VISELKGRVLEIVDQGFRIRSKGVAIIVATQVPGRELHLAPGDMVRVLGGLGPDDNMFYSSMVQKKRRGTWVQIRVNRMDPPDASEAHAARRPWWKIW
jgi:hypothetical protein